ncbi:serine hydrolase domain-containing protein [Candidatus Latescibacterota bacterium]
MKSTHKKILYTLIIVSGLILFGYGDYYLWKLLRTATGIEAKILCSGVFISNRTPESILNEDLHKRVNYIHLEVNANDRVVTATAFGLIKRQAVFRSGLGSTLLDGVTVDDFRKPLMIDLEPKPRGQRRLLWPVGETIPDDPLPSNVNTLVLQTAIDKAFSEPNPERKRLTRAVVVVYDGVLVAERYEPGFKADTPLVGWGMAKSVINALVGILVKQGKLSLDDPVTVPEWSDTDDPRREITLDHLLRMSSGVEFDDSKPPLTDTVVMLENTDMAAYAASKPLVASPGKSFNYSSGTTLIISRLIRDALGGGDEAYFTFPRRALLDTLGMRKTVLETDGSGTFVGSSYIYATARDWARFGLLYLQDGVWEGERILPEGWVEYSITPSPADPMGEYGAHFRTNASCDKNGAQGQWPGLPSDAFFALGHDGQSLTIIPSRKLVVVRLGLTKHQEDWDLEAFITDVLNSISELSPPNIPTHQPK